MIEIHPQIPAADINVSCELIFQVPDPKFKSGIISITKKAVPVLKMIPKIVPISWAETIAIGGIC
jgi:hypothetical protein